MAARFRIRLAPPTGARVIVFAALALLLAACGSLNSEPRIVATTAPVERPGRTGESAGETIFLAHCTACHGEDGRGDGPLVRAGQIAAPPDFTQPAAMSAQDALAIYDVITGGRIEKMMPPWEGALSETERRAVADFVAGLGSGTVVSAPTEAQ